MPGIGQGKRYNDRSDHMKLSGMQIFLAIAFATTVFAATAFAAYEFYAIRLSQKAGQPIEDFPSDTRISRI